MLFLLFKSSGNKLFKYYIIFGAALNVVVSEAEPAGSTMHLMYYFIYMLDRNTKLLYNRAYQGGRVEIYIMKFLMLRILRQAANFFNPFYSC